MQERILKTRDLTKGKITGNILLFAIPLICGNLLQQMYNIADTWKKFPQLLPKREHRKWDKADLTNILNLSVMTCVQQSIMNFGILMVRGNGRESERGFIVQRQWLFRSAGRWRT